MVSSSNASNSRFLTRSALTASSIDYYQLLGIEKFTSDAGVIRSAIQNQLYESQANGLGLTDSLASLRIIQLRRAEAVLTDPKSKQEYDLELQAADLLAPATRLSESAAEIVPPKSNVATQSGANNPPAEKSGESEPVKQKSLESSYAELLMPAKRSGDERTPVDPVAAVKPEVKTPTPTAQPESSSKTPEYRAVVNTTPTGELPTHPDFEFFGIIGEGRQSIVYDAYDLTLDRPVAIKEFKAAVLEDPQRAESVWKEAKFLAGVAHDNILRIYSVNTERGWVIMERVEGSLRQQLKQMGAFDADRAREILRQGLEGLRYLHSKDKLHGEIHPDSLLVDADGRIRLSDSPGFSNSSEFICPDGPLKQIAPEMLSSDIFGSIGPTLDLYCLGYTVLELIAGEDFASFFTGLDQSQIDDPQTWMRWHASPTAKLTSLSELMPKLPADLVAVIEGLTPKKTRDRIATADDALALLQSSNNNGAAGFAASDGSIDNDANEGNATTEQRGAVVFGNPNKAIFGASEDTNVEQKTLAEKLTDPEWLVQQLKNPKLVTGAVLSITLVVGLVILTRPGKPRIPTQRTVQVAAVTPEKSEERVTKPSVSIGGGTRPERPNREQPIDLPFERAPEVPKSKEPKTRKPVRSLPFGDPVEIVKKEKQVPVQTGLKVVPILAGSNPWYFQTALPDDQKQILFDHIREILEESWDKPRVESLAHAEYHYKQAKSLWGNEPRLHLAYGLFLSKSRQPQSAVEILEIAVEKQDEVWERYSSSPDLDWTYYASYEPHRELIRHQLQLKEFEQAGLSTMKMLEIMNEQLAKDSDDETFQKARAEQVEFLATVMAFLELPNGQQVNNYFDLEAAGDRMYEQLASSEQESFDKVYNAMANRFQKVSTNDSQRRNGFKQMEEERKESGFRPMKTGKTLLVTEVQRRSNRQIESRSRQLIRDDIRDVDNDRWKGRRSEILIEVKRYIGEQRAPLFSRAKSISVYIKPNLEFKRQDLIDSLPEFEWTAYPEASQLAKIVE